MFNLIHLFYMNNEISNIQEKIQEELFKEYDKILDRAFSLLQFIFVVLGFYPLVLSNIYGQLDGNIIDNILDMVPDP